MQKPNLWLCGGIIAYLALIILSHWLVIPSPAYLTIAAAAVAAAFIGQHQLKP